MGRIIVTEHASLDGVIEAPGGVEDYRHGTLAMEDTRGDGITLLTYRPANG